MSRQPRPPAKQSANSGREQDGGHIRRKESGRNAIRTQIAQAAARLIAEGLTDVYVAKQKAAQQLGVSKNQTLPDNHEIESALRDYFKLFARDSQWRELQALRKAAIRAMFCLEQFSPWLTGSVLGGTANRFSAVELELIDVEPKHFEMYLLNAQIDFELCDARQRNWAKPAGRPQKVVYRLEFEHAPVTITLYDTHQTRQMDHPGTSHKPDRMQCAPGHSP